MEHIQSAIRAYFDARQEELIQAVCRLVRITRATASSINV